MLTNVKRFLAVSAVLAASAASVGWGYDDSILKAGDKMNFANGPMYHGTSAAPQYQYRAPAVVQTQPVAPAPGMMAQAPSEQRSFSYEPQTQTPAPYAPAATATATNTAQQPNTQVRRYSYEPSMQRYAAPRYRSAPTQGWSWDQSPTMKRYGY